MDKETEEKFTEKETETTLKHMKRCSALFILSKVYIKTYTRILFSLTRIGKIERAEEGLREHTPEHCW